MVNRVYMHCVATEEGDAVGGGWLSCIWRAPASAHRAGAGQPPAARRGHALPPLLEPTMPPSTSTPPLSTEQLCGTPRLQLPARAPPAPPRPPPSPPPPPTMAPPASVQVRVSLSDCVRVTKMEIELPEVTSRAAPRRIYSLVPKGSLAVHSLMFRTGNPFLQHSAAAATKCMPVPPQISGRRATGATPGTARSSAATAAWPRRRCALRM